MARLDGRQRTDSNPQHYASILSCALGNRSANPAGAQTLSLVLGWVLDAKSHPSGGWSKDFGSAPPFRRSKSLIRLYRKFPIRLGKSGAKGNVN